MKVKEFHISKSLNNHTGEQWVKYGLVIDTTDLMEDQVIVEQQRAEKWINGLLKPIQPPPELPPSVIHPHPPDLFEQKPGEIPKGYKQAEFDAEDLLNHEWKKGKKKPDGSYSIGTLAYGWDFSNNFKAETLQALPQTIDGYDFTLSKDQKFVNVRKKK